MKADDFVVSTLHLILRKRIYTGDFDWDGVTYHGKHEALVSQEMWEEVQALLERRAQTKQHRIKHDFAFAGFIRCGHCVMRHILFPETSQAISRPSFQIEATGA